MMGEYVVVNDSNEVCIKDNDTDDWVFVFRGNTVDDVGTLIQECLNIVNLLNSKEDEINSMKNMLKKCSEQWKKEIVKRGKLEDENFMLKKDSDYYLQLERNYFKRKEAQLGGIKLGYGHYEVEK